MNLSRDSTNELLFVGFNQDSGCFACGTTSGFVIYNVNPFRETFRRVFSNGGIGIVEMLFRCNLIAIVGGGRNPRYPTNKVMIWDDHQNKCIGELMFKSEVYAVRLRRDRVVVVLNTKVYVYRFSDLKLLDQITTVSNTKGLVSLCPDTSNNVLAVPGLARGAIRIELYDISKATIIKAHDADLSQFALNADGSRIASASEKGTLIRVWDCHTGDPLREFRRGMDRAEIFCISFNPASSFLACTSDKGTVHIFSLAAPVAATGTGTVSGGSGSEEVYSPPAPPLPPPSSTSATTSVNDLTAPPAAAGGGAGVTAAAENKSLGLNFLMSMVPSSLMPKYLQSEWSYAQFHGIEGRSICAFDKDSNKIVVVTSEGQFITSSFDGGGECDRLSTIRFVKTDADADGAAASAYPEHDNNASVAAATIGTTAAATTSS